MSESKSRSPPPRPRSGSPGIAGSSRNESDRQEHRDRSRPQEHDDRDETRPRSRSPRRDHRSKRKDVGFKWKEKRRTDEDQPRERDEGLKRGYKDHYRPRSRSRSPRGHDSSRHNDGDKDRHRDRRHKDNRHGKSERREKRSQPEEKAPSAPALAAAVQQQPMIIVTVNDRLGTKKQIPCFPTDSVRDFKIIVASMIGRQPHEILLKRQGERPFKDVLTLQDYGVSNNVQLDLEVDTGD